MLTRNEYLSKAKSYQLGALRSTRLFAFFGLVSTFGVSLLLVMASNHILRVYGGVPLRKQWFFPLWGVLAFASIWLLEFLVREIGRRHEMICPSCAKVAEIRDLRIITATHNCPYCGLPFYY